MEEHIIKKLRKCIDHKVTIRYQPNNDSSLLEVVGILKEVNKAVIHLIVFTTFGEADKYYLNRYACTLHSFIDEGKGKKT